MIHPRCARDDSGMALPVVLGAVALLMVLVTAGFYASSQVLFEAQKDNAHDIAYQAASSGVAVAYADLVTKLATLPGQKVYEGSLDSGASSYAVVASLNGSRAAYDCTSTGTAADGTTEVIVVRFAIVAASPQGSMWGKDVFFPGTLMGAILANGQIIGPMYIVFPGDASQNTLSFGSAGAGLSGGPIYIQNGSLVIKQAPPVPVEIYTNGTITLEGSAKSSPEMIINKGWDPSFAITLPPVDTPAFLANALQVATYQSSDNRMGYTASTVVNYESVPAAAPASYSALATNPPNDRPVGWVRSRAPGATQAYKVVQGGLAIDASTPSFGSWSGDGHYPTTTGLHDDFAYDAANGVLYVEGVVYVGGDLTIDAGKRITYVGNGTIVCAGKATFRSDLVPARPTGFDGTPDPDAGTVLFVFAAGDVIGDRNNTLLVAGLYTVGQITVTGNNVTLKGSFIAEHGITGFPNNLNLIAVPAIGSYAPSELPGGDTGGSSALTLSQSAWRRQ